MDALSNGTVFRKYIYDPKDPPFNYFGDLQQHAKTVEVINHQFSDTLGAFVVTVYTTRYDDVAPAAVSNLSVEAAEIENRDRNVLNWDENQEGDLCYYRIYRSPDEDFIPSPELELATTIRTKYIDRTVHNLPQYYYKVIAVDQSGNAGE